MKGSEIRAVPGPGQWNTTLSVSGPDGFYASAFAKRGTPSIDLIREGGTAEGQYKYQITAATAEKAPPGKKDSNGRTGTDGGYVPTATSGSFRATGGLIMQPGTEVE